MATDNPVFNFLDRKLCNWGLKWRREGIDTERTEKYSGGPALIFGNASPKLLLLFAILNILIFAVMFGVYMVEIIFKNQSDVPLVENIIVGIVFTGINSINHSEINLTLFICRRIVHLFKSD
jgi:hypothetical protein